MGFFSFMTRRLVCIMAIFLAILPLAAERVYELDAALAAVARDISAKLPAQSKVVVVTIEAVSREATDYAVAGLTLELLKTGKLVMIDRRGIGEMSEGVSPGTSGDLPSDSFSGLGAKLGAETLITGSFDPANGQYRLSVRAVKGESAEILYRSTTTISSDAQTESLFKASSAAASKEDLDQERAESATARFVYMAMNPCFGIGSFIQGDKKGGSRAAFWEALGAGAIVYGSIREKNEQPNGALLMGTGIFLYGAGMFYSLVRPWVYDRSPEITRVMDKVRIKYMPSLSSASFSVGYVFRY